MLWDVRSECEGDGVTECGDGDSDTDWWIEYVGIGLVMVCCGKLGVRAREMEVLSVEIETVTLIGG
jgi:hypothetical protein